MGSMHVGLEEAKDGFERMAAFYAERAKWRRGPDRDRRHCPERSDGRPYARWCGA
jgi:2,4-dienoyl-CoA reductase (NADPH2)